MEQTAFMGNWTLRRKIIFTLLGFWSVLMVLAIVLSLRQKKALLRELDKKERNPAAFVGESLQGWNMSFQFVHENKGTAYKKI